MMRWQIILVLIMATALPLQAFLPVLDFGSARVAQAQAVPEIFDQQEILNTANLRLPEDDLRPVAITLIIILLGLVGLVFLIFIIYGGFMWMTAAGNAEQAQDARKIIGNGVVGLAIIFVAFALTNFLFNILDDVVRPGLN